MLRGGTIVDATLIAASPSTKNEQQQARSRDVVVEEGKPVVFRHEGARRRRCESGLVHTAGVTTGKVHDAKVMTRLIREDDTAVYGDKGYASDEKKRAAERRRRAVGREGKGEAGPRTHEASACRNRRFGRVRAKVEHVFRVVKCQFGYRKVRYRGIDKNGAQVFALLRARQHLPRPQPTCVRMKGR